MPGVAFVAHCLLNQNSKVNGGASCPGVYSPLVDELREWCRSQLPPFAMPEYVSVLPALPKTPSGKVRKVELREIATRQAAAAKVGA